MKTETNIAYVRNFRPRPFSTKLLEKHEVFCDKFGRLWHYNQETGLWSENTEIVLDAELRQEFLSVDIVKSHYVNEIIADVKGLSFRGTDIPEPHWRFIPFENGVYDLDRRELVAYSPDMFFTTKLAVSYNPDATCPTIDRIFREIVESEKMTDLYEIIAYCLLRDYPNQRLFFLYGCGGNGKTTFVRILENVLGKSNISTVSLFEFQTNRFAGSDLFGKFANISVEVDHRDLNRTGLLKRLTGGDLIRAEKKYQHAFNFRNHAKLLFLVNELPRTPDKTPAFYRRLHLVEFPFVFEGSDEDRLLLSRIPQEEYEGLVAKCVDVLREMMKRGFAFTHESKSSQMAETYEELTNPLDTFLNEHCESNPDGLIPKCEFRQRFAQYLKHKGLRSWSDAQIGNEMKNVYNYEEGKKSVAGKRSWCWLGVKWRM